MRGAKLIRALLTAAPMAGASLLACAQNGALCGRLTDLHSRPLAGVTLTAQQENSAARAQTVTAKNGNYCLMDLTPGSYTLTAESPQLGRGELGEIAVQAGCTAHVQAAMRFTPAPVSAPAGNAATKLSPTKEDLPAMTAAPPTVPLAAQLPKASQPAPATSALTLPERINTHTSAPAILEALPQQTASATDMHEMTTASPRTAVQRAPDSVELSPGPARTAPVQTGTAEIGLTLDAEELQALPVRGHNWEEFAQAAPGATSAAAPASDTLEGASTEPAETTVDGVSTRLAYGRGNERNRIDEEANDASADEAMAQSPAEVSEAAVGTLEVRSSQAAAQSSRAAGGRRNVSTARGGDSLHGQLFYYDRQSNWGARNPYTQWVKESTAGTTTTLPGFTAYAYTPPNHEISGGGGVGGPLRQRQMHWFLAADALHNNDPAVSTVRHPDLFFEQPTNDRLQLLGAQLGSENAAIPKYGAMLETLDGLLGPTARTQTHWNGFARLDWKMGERQTLLATFAATSTDAPGGGLTRTAEPYGTHSFGNASTAGQRALARWEYFLTPNLLASSAVAFSHNVHRPHPGTPSSYEQAFNINVWNQLPQIVIDSSYGFTIGNPARFGQGDAPNERGVHLQESLDWVRGTLLVNAGVQMDYAEDRTTVLRNLSGTYHYANVANFVTDALAFTNYGIGGALSASNPHTCDQTGKVWRDSSGGLRGLGNYPCYSYYTQTMGPAGRHVSTNAWGGYAMAQWQPQKNLVLSAGLRWERTVLPAAIPALANSDLPLAGLTPRLGNNWGPRVSLALGSSRRAVPTLRLGYGMYFAPLPNRTLMTAMTETGSANGDLNFYLRPTDNRTSGGAPPFPYVFAGEPLTVVKPGAVEFAQNFHSSEIHQAIVALEEKLAAHTSVTAAAMVSLGRRLPVTVDTNFDTSVNPGTITYAVSDSSGKGPIKAARLTVPFYANWPTTSGATGRANTSYQQVVAIASRANSTYEAAMLRLDRSTQRGLTLHASYTYAHAMDWNPNEGSVLGTSVLDPANFALEYATSNLDARHTATMMLVYNTPWRLPRRAGLIANNWMLSGIGRYHSGLPYTMRTSGSLPKQFTTAGSAIVGLGSSLNGLGGDNRIYGTGSNNVSYNLGRNQYRYPSTWKADLRLAKNFPLEHARELQLLAESFNLFNHQNVTEIETIGYRIESGSSTGGLPTLTFMNGATSGSTAFGAPLNVNATNIYRERQIEFGMRLRF